MSFTLLESIGKMHVMRNPYIIQSIGLAVTAIGVLALIAMMTLYGRPVSREDRHRPGEKNRVGFNLPINIETIISTIIMLCGLGILAWSNFDLCKFIVYWLPNLPKTLMITLQCR